MRCRGIPKSACLPFFPSSPGVVALLRFHSPSSDQPVSSGKPAAPTRASKWDPGIPVYRKRARPRQVWRPVLQLGAGRPGAGCWIRQGFRVICKQGQLSWISLRPGTTVRVGKRLFLWKSEWSIKPLTSTRDHQVVVRPTGQTTWVQTPALPLAGHEPSKKLTSFLP